MHAIRPGLPSVAALVPIAAMIVFGCASAPRTPDPESAGDPKLETWGKVDSQDLDYPSRVGPFTLVEMDDFEEVALGVRLKYADSTRPDAIIDAYVYPMKKPDTLSLTRVLDWEMSSVSLGMEEVARQNGMKAGEPAWFPFGLSREKEPRGLGVMRTLSSSTTDFESLAYLVVRDHRFFKLRITVPRSNPDSEDDGYFQNVVDVLQPAIQLKRPFEKPAFGVTVYRNVFLAPQHESCNIGGWIAYGIEMAQQIEAQNYRNTLARELAARKRVLEFWRKLRDGGKPCASEVLEVMSRVEEAGFLTEYVFEAHGRGTWTAPDEARIEAWKRWSRSNLEVHDPVVDPGVAVEWKTESDENGSPTP